MDSRNQNESDEKWWIRYVLIPLIVAFIAGGGGTAVIVSIRDSQPPTPTIPATPTSIATVTPTETSLPNSSGVVTPSTAPQAIQLPTPSDIPPAPTSIPTVVVEWFEVSVDSRDGWQYFDIEVNTNEIMTIRYVSGEWTGDINSPQRTKGESAPWAERTEECLPVKGQGSSLVGRVGNGAPFVVGQYFSEQVQSTGRLALRMNDCDQWLGDNGGVITVNISFAR